MADLPPELKRLKRFIREAKKTEKVSPVIAYYCRLYAIQEAMKLDENKKSPSTKQWVSSQIGQLEENKVDVPRDDAKSKIESMADNVFQHADKTDRDGKANKQTAAAFNSSFIFYEILKQFGQRDEDQIARSKYCMFKVTDILKALKEGRKPKPGPPGGDEEDDAFAQELDAMGGGGGSSGNGMGMNNNNQTNDIQQPPPSYQSPPSNDNNNNNNNMNYNNNNNNNNYANPSQPSYNNQPNPTPMQAPTNYNRPPPQQQYVDPNQYMVDAGPQYNYQKQMNLPKFEKKIDACINAERCFKEAMAALRFEDADTAIKKAEEAIAVLAPHR